MLNVLPGGQVKGEHVKSLRSAARCTSCYHHCLFLVLRTLTLFAHSFADKKRQFYIWCLSAEKRSSGRRWSCGTVSPRYFTRSESIWSMWVKQKPLCWKLSILNQHLTLQNTFKTLSGGVAVHHDVQTEGKSLAQAEASLGDHVTGGVVQRWRQVQRKLGDLLSEGTNPS